MKVQAIRHEDVSKPNAVVSVFRDANGNWFCSVEVGTFASDRSSTCTQTWSEVREAVEQAGEILQRVNDGGRL